MRFRLGVFFTLAVLAAGCQSTPPEPTLPVAYLSATVTLQAQSTVTSTPIPSTPTSAKQVRTGQLNEFDVMTPATPFKPRPTRTSTPYISPTPTLTSTPMPTLQAHTWVPKPVLLKLDFTGGDGCCESPQLPKLILYADGRFFHVVYKTIDGRYRRQILTTTLDRGSVCAILNTVDQTGFFDYDPSTYVSPGSDYLPIDGASFWDISVAAWREAHVSAYALGTYLTNESSWNEYCEGCSQLPVILPSLRYMFSLLTRYEPSGMDVYKPEIIALRIWLNGDRLTGEDWPLQLPALKDLYDRAIQSAKDPGQELVLRGKEAELVYELFQETMDVEGLAFHDQDHSYFVYMRPLLPYEAPTAPGAYDTTIPSPGFAAPNQPMTCTPDDGVLTEVFGDSGK